MTVVSHCMGTQGHTTSPGHIKPKTQLKDREGTVRSDAKFSKIKKTYFFI